SSCSNFLVCWLQTGVSSEGTTLKRRAFAGVLARVTDSRAPLRQSKSGALSPFFSCGPTRDKGLPLNVTAFARFCMVNTLPCEQDRKRLENRAVRVWTGPRNVKGLPGR